MGGDGEAVAVTVTVVVTVTVGLGEGPATQPERTSAEAAAARRPPRAPAPRLVLPRDTTRPRHIAVVRRSLPALRPRIRPSATIATPRAKWSQLSAVLTGMKLAVLPWSMKSP